VRRSRRQSDCDSLALRAIEARVARNCDVPRRGGHAWPLDSIPERQRKEGTMPMLRALVVAAALLAATPAAAIEPFFAAPVPTGNLQVRLHPTEVVTAGTPKLVTFGVPFPRGSISAAQLATLRVLRNGTELPTHVEQLTPWRHRSSVAIDGQSVRVALVQLTYTFQTTYPGTETITIDWGQTARTLDVPALANARNAWHQVADGTFVAADNVWEPDVYAVLPADWLVRGALKSSRSTVLDPSNAEPRDDPATNDAIAHWPDFQEAERAAKNNWYSVVNRDDPLVSGSNQCPYKTAREPWLYDRAATMFVLYMRGGFFGPLREGVRAAQFYSDRQNAQGFFTVDGATGDAKYAYNESLAYTYWLTGDPTLPAKIGAVTQAQDTFPHVWTPSRNFWTERHAAFKLLGNVVAWEVLGGSARRDAVEQILADYRAHQDGAGGQIPAQRIDGGLYHYGGQHDYDWDENAFGGSSWMSALLSDAVVRAYATGEDAASAQFLARLGNFLRATVVVTDEHSVDTYDGALALPRYAMLIDGADGQRNYEDIEHALDVAGQLAWAHWFAEVGGSADTLLENTALNLYASYDETVNFWIRPAAPQPPNFLTAYRVSPWRKWGWEHRTSDGLAFALADGTAGSPTFRSFEQRLELRRNGFGRRRP
jgi:hypothetical protein